MKYVQSVKLSLKGILWRQKGVLVAVARKKSIISEVYEKEQSNSFSFIDLV